MSEVIDYELKFRHEETGIAPLPGMLLIDVDVPPEKTKGGVIIPDQVRDQQGGAAETGIILAAGEGCETFFLIGRRIAFTRYAGQDMQGIDGKMYRVVAEEDCKAYTLSTRKMR